MPRRSKAQKKSPSKRTYKKRARGRPTRRYAVSIPNLMRVRLKYNDVYNLATLVGGAETNTVWRPNDLFDPFFSGIGHQSLFRDQWYGLYHWARCIAFTMKITIINTENNFPLHVCMLPMQDSSVITFATASEMKGCKKAVITNSRPVKLYLRYYVDRFLGNKKGTCITDDQFKQGTSSPLDQKASCWVHIYFKNFNTVKDLAPMVQYEVIQMCGFSEPIVQSLS